MSTTLDLDHAATAPVRRSALEAMWPALTGVYGNPSSAHEAGRAAAALLEDALGLAGSVPIDPRA